MTDPSAQADTTDIAERARLVGAESRDAGRHDDASPTGAGPVPDDVFWPPAEFDSLTKRRSFIQDLASGNRRYSRTGEG